MNTHLGPIDPSGPLIRVGINLPAIILLGLRQARKPIPPPVEVWALIDTGADVTVVDPSVFSALSPRGLKHNRMIFVNAPALGQPGPVFEYLVSLAVPAGTANPLEFRSLAVVERALGALGY